MIYKTAKLPVLTPSVGDVWLCPHGSFKRVLSRGGAWENVNLGSKHPDEKDHDYEQSSQSKAEQRDENTEISSGAGKSSSGNGDDGEMPGGGRDGEGSEDASLKGEGVDGEGSEVV